MMSISILQKAFNALQRAVDTGENCELTPRQCRELLRREEILTRACDDYLDEISKLRRLLELEKGDD